MASPDHSRRYRSIGIDLNAQISSPFKSLLQTIPANTDRSLEEDIPNLDALFSKNDLREKLIWAKFEELKTLNSEINDLVQFSLRPNILPTPDDDNYKGKPYQEETGASYHDTYENQYPKTEESYIPSSPESFTSNKSQIEVELNNKLNKLAHQDHINRDVIKLRNVIHNTLDLIQHPIHDTTVKDLNSETRKRSQELTNKLVNLVESYSTN